MEELYEILAMVNRMNATLEAFGLLVLAALDDDERRSHAAGVESDPAVEKATAALRVALRGDR